MFAHTTGIKMIHVPYRGSGPSLTDAIGGQIPIVTATLAAAMPHIKAGKLKALAVTRSEEHTSELQSLMRNSYAVFCLKKKKKKPIIIKPTDIKSQQQKYQI